MTGRTKGTTPAPGDGDGDGDDVRRAAAAVQPAGRRRQAEPFPPIAEYAFLSDCETNALVAPSGNVEWLCSPRPVAIAVFASMLDGPQAASGSGRPG